MMFKDFRNLSLAQRRLVFFLVFGGGLALLVGVTVILAASALTSGQRQLSRALVDGVSVREFAALPDSDAYPAAVAVAPDGTVYTGSFGSGALFRITPDGAVSEIAGTRDAIGAVFGLAVAPDGALLVIDQIDTDPRSAGGALIRIPLNPDGTLAGEIDTFYALPEDGQGYLSPHDVATAPDGTIYVSDSGRNQVFRFNSDGSGGAVWWVPPSTTTRIAISGLAIDPVTESLLITEPEQNTIFRVRLADGTTDAIYQHQPNQPNPPGFNGITVTPDGVIYVAALGQNGIAIVQPPDSPSGDLNNPGSTLNYIAGLFRGASDVAFDESRNRLFVTNFDQSALVIPLVQPQLPFAIDVIELEAIPLQSS
jgi:sugar lactone lactonase YvrE